MRCGLGPAFTLVVTDPQFARGGSEVETQRIETITGKRLSQDREVSVLAREAAILSLPGGTAVARLVYGGFAVGTGARPGGGRIHRKYPRPVGVARVEHDAKADVADRSRHVAADSQPIFAGTIEPVDATVILLVKPVGVARMHRQTMGILSVLGIGIGQEIRFHVVIEWSPALTTITGFEHPHRRGTVVHVRSLARIDQHRAEHLVVRRHILGRRPFSKHRIAIETFDLGPGRPAIFAPKKTRRRGAGVPDSGFASQRWRQ